MGNRGRLKHSKTLLLVIILSGCLNTPTYPSLNAPEYVSRADFASFSCHANLSSGDVISELAGYRLIELDAPREDGFSHVIQSDFNLCETAFSPYRSPPELINAYNFEGGQGSAAEKLAEMIKARLKLCENLEFRGQTIQCEDEAYRDLFDMVGISAQSGDPKRPIKFIRIFSGIPVL